MSQLGAGVNETQIDALQVLPGRVLHQRLTKDQRTLLHTHHSTLDHDPVLTNHSVVDKTTHGSNALLRQVSLSLAAGTVSLLSDAVDLLVHLSAVEVAILTSTRYSVRHTSRMPRSNTSNLAKATVCLAGKAGDTPTSCDTLVSTPLGYTENIHKFILRKDRVNSDLLFEETLGKVNLRTGIGTSIDLDLHDVGLLHAKVELLHLGMGDDAHDLAELGDTLELSLDVLSVVLGVLLRVFGVGLALGLVPILVAAPLELLAQVLSEDGGQRAEATGGLEVADDADDDHGGSFEDGDGVDDLALVHDGARAVDAADNVSHAGLIGAESGEVGRGRGIVVLREGADAPGVVFSALLREEPKGAAAGSFELAVRHGLII